MSDKDFGYLWAWVLAIGFVLALTLAVTDVRADQTPEPSAATAAPNEWWQCKNKEGCKARSRNDLKVYDFYPGDILGPKNWEVREWKDDWEYHWQPPR